MDLGKKKRQGGIDWTVFVRQAVDQVVNKNPSNSCEEQHQDLHTAAAAVPVCFHLIGKACITSPEYHLDAETSFRGLRGTSARSRSRYIGFPHSIKDLEQLSPGIEIILCDSCRLWLSDFREVWFGCDPRRSAASENSVDRRLLFLASQWLREQVENSMFRAADSVTTLGRSHENGALFEFAWCVSGQAATGLNPPTPFPHSVTMSLRLSVRPSVALPSAAVRNVAQRCCISVCLRLSKVQSGENVNGKACPRQTSLQHTGLVTGSDIWCICQIERAGVCARCANRETLRGKTKNMFLFHEISDVMDKMCNQKKKKKVHRQRLTFSCFSWWEDTFSLIHSVPFKTRVRTCLFTFGT